MSAEDLPSANMPDEAPQLGQQTQLEASRKAIESAGTPGGAAAQPGAPPPAGAQPAPAGAPPVQPAPRQPLTPGDLQPGGPVFTAPKLRPTYPWRQELRLWAAHPDAGPFLGALRRRADAHLEQQPPTTPTRP